MYLLNNHIPADLFTTPAKSLYTIPHYVYILKIVLPSATLYKIGKSNDVTKRIKSLSSLEKPSSAVCGRGIVINSINCIAIAELNNLKEASMYESYLLNKYNSYKYTDTPILSQGNTELFTTNILLEIQSGR